MFLSRYSKDPPGRSIILQWYNNYRIRGTHTHRGGSSRPQIRDVKESEIISLFRSKPGFLLHTVTAQTGIAHATVWNSLRRELKKFPYKVQVGFGLSRKDKLKRLSSNRNYRRELRNDSSYLKRIVLSD